MPPDPNITAVVHNPDRLHDRVDAWGELSPGERVEVAFDTPAIQRVEAHNTTTVGCQEYDAEALASENPTPAPITRLAVGTGAGPVNHEDKRLRAKEAEQRITAFKLRDSEFYASASFHGSVLPNEQITECGLIDDDGRLHNHAPLSDVLVGNDELLIVRAELRFGPGDANLEN